MSKGYQDYFLSFSKSSVNATGRSSFYTSKQNSLLTNSAFSKLSHNDKLSLFRQVLNNKTHGVSFSLYLDNQKPGTKISQAQISQRLNIIKPYTDWIRTFSCVEDNQQTPKIAHKQGLKTLVGIDIAHDRNKNEIEIAKASNADILTVGNAVLLRGDISEYDLIEYIKRVKQALPEQVVGYVDAYFLFEEHPPSCRYM